MEELRPKILRSPEEQAAIETLKVVFDAMRQRYGSERARELISLARLRAGLEERRAFGRPRRVVAPGASGRPSSSRAYVSP